MEFMCTMCVQVLMEDKKGLRFPGTRVSGGCDTACGY